MFSQEERIALIDGLEELISADSKLIEFLHRVNGNPSVREEWEAKMRRIKSLQSRLLREWALENYHTETYGPDHEL